MTAEIRCPKCGNYMQIMPDTDYQLYDVRTVDAMCPVCLHVEKLEVLVVKEGDRCHTIRRGTTHT